MLKVSNDLKEPCHSFVCDTQDHNDTVFYYFITILSISVTFITGVYRYLCILTAGSYFSLLILKLLKIEINGMKTTAKLTMLQASRQIKGLKDSMLKYYLVIRCQVLIHFHSDFTQLFFIEQLFQRSKIEQLFPSHLQLFVLTTNVKSVK